MKAKEGRAALLRLSKRKVKMSLGFFRPGGDVPPKRIPLVRRIAWACACSRGGAGKMVSSCIKHGIPSVSKVYSSACPPTALVCQSTCTHSKIFQYYTVYTSYHLSKKVCPQYKVDWINSKNSNFNTPRPFPLLSTSPNFSLLVAKPSFIHGVMNCLSGSCLVR